MKTERNGKMITDWLEKNGNPEIEKQVEKELKNMFANKIFNENCLDTMNRMPDDFINLTVTSPPYDDLRTYNGYCFDFENVAKELFRVTKQGGVVVWVVGDSTVKGSESGTSFRQALYFKEIGFNMHDTMIYKKANAMPNANSKRYRQCFEYMFVFSKGEPKTFNPIMIDVKRFDIGKQRQKNGSIANYERKYSENKERKIDNIFEYGVGGLNIGHPAIFPEQLANDHIISWSNEKDLVYDCFAGSGTTAKMALLNKRNYIGSEISKQYCDIIEQRLNQTKAQLTMF
jgi:site-specific DNA-methyltransferase (adenine-specific)